jgi:hypothetical protein
MIFAAIIVFTEAALVVTAAGHPKIVSLAIQQDAIDGIAHMQKGTPCKEYTLTSYGYDY